MELADIYSLYNAGQYTTTVETGDVFLLGRPNSQRGDKYSVLAINKTDLTSYILSQAPSPVVLTGKLNLSTAQLKTGNSVPITMVAAPGVGKALVGLTTQVNYSAGNGLLTFTDFIVFAVGGASDQLNTGTTVDSTTSDFFQLKTTSAGNRNQIVENAALTISTDNNSAIGTGSATVYYSYMIITL